MKLNFKKAIVYFVYSYILVTILAYGLSGVVGFTLQLPSYTDLGVSMFEDPVFLITVPYHLLINLLCNFIMNAGYGGSLKFVLNAMKI